MFRISFLITLLLALFVQQGLGQTGLIVGQEPWLKVDSKKEFVNIKSVVNNFAVTESRDLILSASPTPLKTFDTGWFCRLDANLDVKLPYKLRFRLGEYHYTRRLEYGEEY